MSNYRVDTGSVKKCSRCGEEFLCHVTSHAYKGELNRLFCSYKCYNAYWKEKEKAFREKRKEQFEDNDMWRF
jgi:hypothetical protein